MPRRRKAPKDKQTITQTVKVVIADGRTGKKRKPRGRRPARREMAAAPPVAGGLQNTIYGEPAPLPPRLIEVPTYYRLSEGATPATGAPAPPMPAIEAPKKPAGLLMAPPAPISEEKPTGLLAPEKKPARLAIPGKDDMEIFYRTPPSYPEEEFGGIKPKKDTFYGKHEKKPLMEIMPEPAKPKVFQETRSDIETFSSMAAPSEPSLMKKDIASEFKTIVGSVAAESAQKVGELAAEKTGEAAGGFLGGALSAILPSSLKPIGKAVGGIAGGLVGETLKSKIPKKKVAAEMEGGEEGAAAPDVVTESIQKIKASGRPNWNVSTPLQEKYVSYFGGTQKEAKKFLQSVQKKYPRAHPQDIIAAIESRDFSGFP